MSSFAYHIIKDNHKMEILIFSEFHVLPKKEGYGNQWLKVQKHSGQSAINVYPCPPYRQNDVVCHCKLAISNMATPPRLQKKRLF